LRLDVEHDGIPYRAYGDTRADVHLAQQGLQDVLRDAGGLLALLGAHTRLGRLFLALLRLVLALLVGVLLRGDELALLLRGDADRPPGHVSSLVRWTLRGRSRRRGRWGATHHHGQHARV